MLCEEPDFIPWENQMLGLCAQCALGPAFEDWLQDKELGSLTLSHHLQLPMVETHEPMNGAAAIPIVLALTVRLHNRGTTEKVIPRMWFVEVALHHSVAPQLDLWSLTLHLAKYFPLTHTIRLRADSLHTAV